VTRFCGYVNIFGLNPVVKFGTDEHRARILVDGECFGIACKALKRAAHYANERVVIG